MLAPCVSTSRSEAAVEAPGFNPAKGAALSRPPPGPEVFWRRIDRECGIRRGPGEIFGFFGEMSADRVRVDVVPMSFVVASIFDTAQREVLFPDGHFGF